MLCCSVVEGSRSLDKNLFVDDLEEKGGVTAAGASSQIYGRPSPLCYELDCYAKNFIKNNMEIYFEGFPPDSEEIAEQRPRYLVEGQRLGQSR